MESCSTEHPDPQPPSSHRRPAPPLTHAHTCWKACTPTLRRVTPSARYAANRAASKVPGSASRDTSAPAAMPKRWSSASRMAPSSSGGSREGVCGGQQATR